MSKNQKKNIYIFTTLKAFEMINIKFCIFQKKHNLLNIVEAILPQIGILKNTYHIIFGKNNLPE